MKTGIITILAATAFLFGTKVNAQYANTGFNEYGNTINQYGAPTFTGGTVNTPSESFAVYTQENAKTQQATLISDVYPNPTRNQSSLELTSIAANPVTVFIVNMNGTIMKTYSYDGGTNRLNFDISNLQDGLYSIQVQERGKSMQSIKLLKQS